MQLEVVIYSDSDWCPRQNPRYLSYQGPKLRILNLNFLWPTEGHIDIYIWWSRIKKWLLLLLILLLLLYMLYYYYYTTILIAYCNYRMGSIPIPLLLLLLLLIAYCNLIREWVSYYSNIITKYHVMSICQEYSLNLQPFLQLFEVRNLFYGLVKYSFWDK